MSCMYVLWDVIDDTIARKVNTSDASAFADICGCCPSRVWGVIWLIQAIVFFGLGVIVGLVSFKVHPSPYLPLLFISDNYVFDSKIKNNNKQTPRASSPSLVPHLGRLDWPPDGVPSSR